MVSSALYRYFPSRDDLLTASMIIDAYDALVGEGGSRGQDPGRSAYGVARACRAVRAWAIAHPHEYALIYGSPVARYKAPESTIQPAGRVAVALLGIRTRPRTPEYWLLLLRRRNRLGLLAEQLTVFKEMAPEYRRRCWCGR